MKIAVLGYGNIGNGVVRILDEKKELVAEKAGESVEVRYVLDLREFPGDSYEHLLVHDFDTILNDEEVALVVETMGGTGAAYTFVKAALEAGKSAVTSNKALVAKYGSELLKIAAEKNINFMFEASVGGAIPIIRGINSSMTGTNITAITGILNGTTNFMLSKMAEGMEYDEALKLAQDLGYAERDPSADVEGFDTCRKIAILSSIAFGRFTDFEDIPTTGITGVTKKDLDMAAKLGCKVRLLGSAAEKDGAVAAEVAPVAVEEGHPLYAVNDVFNSILVSGDMSGDLMFFGSGAGKLPTASAVVADIVECVKNSEMTLQPGWRADKLPVVSMDGSPRSFLVWFDRELPDEVAGSVFGAEKCATDGQTVLITAPMTRAECEQKAAGYGAVSIFAVAR